MLPYAPWLSWLIPLLGSFSAPILAKTSRKVLQWTPFLLVLISSIFTFSMLPDVYNGHSRDISVKWIPFLNLSIGMLIDSLSVFMASVVSFIGALIFLYSVGYMAEEKGLTRYYFFMLLFIGSMIGLVMADNLIQLYIFWELVGLCSYALIGFWYKRPEAIRAGMKAFIVTRFGDLCLLAGILLLYFNAREFNFLALKEAFTGLLSTSLITTSALLLFGGAVSKSAQVPLFVWLPDAMEGPTTVSALIHATAMVKAGVYLTARTVTILPVTSDYLFIVATIGAITAFMAATMALAAFDIKRVLAYSTISQLGYMFLALGVPMQEGWLASQFHLMSHAIFKALLFLCAGVIIRMLGTRDMRQMGGLAKRMRVIFLAFLIGAFSLSAIPPFNGFWSKEMILEATYKMGGQAGMLLFLAGVVSAAITFAYVIRMIGLVFLGEESNYVKAVKMHEVPKVMTLPLLVLAVACIVSGFLQTPFMNLFHVENLHMPIDTVSLAFSLLALTLGGLPAYIVYIKRSIPPEKITGKPVTNLIYRILANGYYFDSLYNLIFVKGTAIVSSKVRKLQTGVLNVNMLTFLAGLACLLLLAVQGGIL